MLTDLLRLYRFLYILFIAPLYLELKKERGISIIGFVNDTNFFSYGKSFTETVIQLQRAYRRAEE